MRVERTFNFKKALLMKRYFLLSLNSVLPVMLLLSSVATHAERLTYPDIVRRLYDLTALAQPPLAGETSGSATSRDRASRYDAATDTYVDWGANNDGSGYVRKEGENIVAAELKGPGIIWRIWSAKPEDGAIEMIIDGRPEPALDMPFKNLFDPTNGPFRFPELVRNMAGGWNCFVPIPYQESCKIVLKKGWGAYFQFTYTKLASNTVVASFRGSFNDEETKALSEADRIWMERGAPVPGIHNKVTEREFLLAPGQTAALTLEGAQAISGFICSIGETNAAGVERMLREITLSIAWDGEQQPSVWCPLGDFFGGAPGLNPFRGLPEGMSRDSIYASWYMPFGTQAVIRLANEGFLSRRLNLKVIHEPLTQPANKLLRFHAKWHRDNYGPDGVGRYAKDRYPDWPVLILTHGPGRFCGMHLDVWNPNNAWDKNSGGYAKKVSEMCPDPAWFRREVIGGKYWWGEGDEKYFVDGEKDPSTFGTGSEDYFGFAWGTPRVFDSATQCQTLNHNNTGHISLVRWQIADNVPFQKSFEGCIEKYHGNNWPLLYDATAYWYQTPGVTDDYHPVPLSQREDYYVMPEPKTLDVPTDGIYEEEQDFLIHATSARVQDMLPYGTDWRNNEQWLWDGKIGEALDFTFETREPRIRHILIQLTQASDYGVFDVLLDGKTLSRGVDCYAPVVRLAPMLDLGQVSLNPGRHTITFKLVWANPAAQKALGTQYLLGFNFLKLATQKPSPE